MPGTEPKTTRIQNQSTNNWTTTLSSVLIYTTVSWSSEKTADIISTSITVLVFKDRTIPENEMDNVKGNAHGLIWGIIPMFVWTDWENHKDLLKTSKSLEQNLVDELQPPDTSSLWDTKGRVHKPVLTT
jgi:hypothetical protein